MRRAAVWFLILALILLAVCVLWLLPRLLRDPPPPVGSDIAAAQPASDAADSTLRTAPGNGTQASQDLPGASDAAGVEARPDEGPDERDALEPASRAGRIFGRIVDRAGRGVAGASVLAAHAADLGQPIDPDRWWIAHLPLDVQQPIPLSAAVPVRTTSDAQGAFVFDPFEPGRARIAVRSAPFAPIDRDDLLVVSGDSLDLGEIRLTPGTSVIGRVFDPSGTSVAGAPLVFHDDFAGATLPPLSPRIGAAAGITDVRGEFRAPPLGPGPKTLYVSGGLELADVWLRPPASADGALVEVQLAYAVGIEGRLRTSRFSGGDVLVRALPATATRAPVPFACRADARQTRVLENGTFSLRGLERHVIYELRASAPGRAFEETSAWCPPTFALADAQGAEGVLVAWEPDASITFSLVDVHGETSFAECACALDGALPGLTHLAPATEDSRGIRRVAELRPRGAWQRARCTLATRAFRPVVQAVDLAPGVDLELGPLRIDPVPVLTVHVVDAGSGRPIAPALVTASESDLLAAADAGEAVDASGLPAFAIQTDAHGEARVPSFGGAASELRVEARGYAVARRRGPFSGGYGEARIDVALVAGASVRVHALDTDGDPVPGARIEHVEGAWSPNDAPRERALRRPGSNSPGSNPIGGTAGAERSRIADRRGEVVFTHLAPGRHAFRVQRWNDYLDGEWTLRELSDGEELELELVTEAWSSLEVKITDRNRPLAGAPVALMRRSSVADPLGLVDPDAPLPPGFRARLDERGACTFQSVDPGRYVVVFGIEGQRLRGLRDVHVRAGGTSLPIELSAYELAGRIVVGQGEPAAGATVYVTLRPGDRFSPRLRAPYRIADLAPNGSPHESIDPLLGTGEIAAVVADENGDFRLLGLPRQEPFGLAARLGYYGLGRGEPFVLRDGVGTEDVSIQLASAGAIEVEALLRPTSGSSILCALQPGRNGAMRFARAFPGERVVFDALAPGEWQIFAASEGAADDRFSPRATVEVVAGAMAQVDLRFP